MLDGIDYGETVGVIDGANVGYVGMPDGDNVGEIVGIVDGELLGSLDGENDGYTVGFVDGATVGFVGVDVCSVEVGIDVVNGIMDGADVRRSFCCS